MISLGFLELFKLKTLIENTSKAFRKAAAGSGVIVLPAPPDAQFPTPT